MESRRVIGSEISQSSLMAMLNKFVQAVDSMDDKIMIPSRLRDMSHNSTPDIAEENNNMSLLPVASPGTDLYSYYVMLNTIKREISSAKGMASEGEMELSSEDSDDGCSNTARKTTEAFRYHLQGLFGMLHQLTDTAKFIGDQYESGVGSSKRLKKFEF